MSGFAVDTLSFMLVNSLSLKKTVTKMKTKLQHLTENNEVFFFFLSTEVRVRFMAPTSTVQFLSKRVRQKKCLTDGEHCHGEIK